MQDACGVELKVTANSALPNERRNGGGSNRAISENGCQMARLRRTSEMVRGRMAVEAFPVCTLEHPTALWN